jgi:hypothetical protein
MGLLANRPPVSDMRSSLINKEEQFLTTHIYKHSKLPNKSESDEIKLVCHISSNILETFGIRLVCDAWKTKQHNEHDDEHKYVQNE